MHTDKHFMWYLAEAKEWTKHSRYYGYGGGYGGYGGGYGNGGGSG